MYTDIADSVYLLDVLVVVIYISHRNCWEYLLLHQDWGECSEGWAGAWRWVVWRGGGKFVVTEGVGILGCLGCGSENDTLLPMTMTCDRLKFWSGPAWRSKVIIRKPWRRKNNNKKKFWQNHKVFPAGSRECLTKRDHVISLGRELILDITSLVRGSRIQREIIRQQIVTNMYTRIYLLVMTLWC